MQMCVGKRWGETRSGEQRKVAGTMGGDGQEGGLGRGIRKGQSPNMGRGCSGDIVQGTGNMAAEQEPHVVH